MKVREVLYGKGRDVHAVSPEASMQDAVHALMAHRIGALLVIDHEGVTRGIVTERDILRECAGGPERLRVMPVRSAMTTDLIVGLLDDDIDEAMSTMTRNRIRHLPIMDGGRVAGLVSIGDLVKSCLDEASSENGFLREYIHGR